MSAGLSDFFQYHLWANRRLLDICAPLTDAQLDNHLIGAFGTIRETLVHMLGAEEGYVSSFTKVSPTQPSLKELDRFTDFEDLRQRAERSGQQLIRIVQEFDLDQTFWLDSGTYESPAIIVVIQALHHGIDHRSQISSLLQQQGIEVPDTDAWAYNEDILQRRDQSSEVRDQKLDTRG